jgi:hypothetical protein
MHHQHCEKGRNDRREYPAAESYPRPVGSTQAAVERDHRGDQENGDGEQHLAGPGQRQLVR